MNEVRILPLSYTVVKVSELRSKTTSVESSQVFRGNILFRRNKMDRILSSIDTTSPKVALLNLVETLVTKLRLG